jgi:hypothetical protein
MVRIEASPAAASYGRIADRNSIGSAEPPSVTAPISPPLKFLSNLGVGEQREQSGSANHIADQRGSDDAT